LIDSAWLAARQNTDGGWGYTSDRSAVEPTGWALLALSLSSDSRVGSAFHRGLRWLADLQHPDGSWPPRPGVVAGTWVTALPLLLPERARASFKADAAATWLISQSGRESSLVQRLRTVMIGVRSGPDVSNDGWAWFPNTAAWVVPTSITLAALRTINLGARNPHVHERIRSGQEFLRARMCSDGGWNHGASRSFGYEAGSYPETTGAALIGLAGVSPPKLARSLDTAQRQLAGTSSNEAAAWLELGLNVHGVEVQHKSCSRQPRTVPEAALIILAEVAAQGKNVFAQ
jgi:hypothetical protein